MNKIYRFLIRISAFVGKEIFAILRQPMLVLTLVLGPFLILLLFGLGFRNDARALRTLFVVDSNSSLSSDVENYVSTLGPQLIYMGVTSDRVEANQKLLERKVDVVAEIPSDAYESIRQSKQAVLNLRHHEIDPFQIEYVDIFGQAYVDEINRRILRTVTERSQHEVNDLDDMLTATRNSATSLRQAMESNSEVAARQHQQDLKKNVDNLALAIGATVGVLKDIQNTVGVENSYKKTDAILSLISNVQDYTNTLPESEVKEPTTQSKINDIKQIEDDLTELETLLNEFKNIDPRVLVSPFRSEATSITGSQIDPADFFAPTIIILLLQHLAVTFGALSIVKESQIGTIELFRVSPISPFETIVSKYLSYLIFSAALATILSLIMIYGLGVPMLGNWSLFSLSLAAVLFASLGFGFVISLLAKTDSAAVQYSMIMMLTSVFFSGAFIGLHALWAPVRVVSWALPATYGILFLQNIMLRGSFANPLLLFGLINMGVVLFLFAWLLLHRRMART